MFTLTVPDEAHANVDRMARLMGVSIEEVFSRALTLLNMAIEAKVQGNKMIILDSEGNVEDEITGF